MVPKKKRIRTSYTKALEKLGERVLELGESAHETLCSCLTHFSSIGRGEVTAYRQRDRFIDRLDRKIQEEIVEILALQQPMAGDLRHLVAAMKISTTFEVIGDYVKNIARRAPHVADSVIDKALLEEVVALGHKVSKALGHMLQALGDEDVDRAMKLRDADIKIDQDYYALYEKIEKHMYANPSSISQAVHLLFILKNLERIGDLITEIAEFVHYEVEGAVPPLRRLRPKVNPIYDL